METGKHANFKIYAGSLYNCFNSHALYEYGRTLPTCSAALTWITVFTDVIDAAATNRTNLDLITRRKDFMMHEG